MKSLETLSLPEAPGTPGTSDPGTVELPWPGEAGSEACSSAIEATQTTTGKALGPPSSSSAIFEFQV